MTSNNAPVADAPLGNWVDRYAPSPWRPYLRLARADRPIGWWLLLLPCWWGLALAGGTPWTHPAYYILFLIGAVTMRGAGCVLNDIADREFDARIERTRSRPIPSGQVSIRQAVIFMGLLCLTGLAVLLQFNWLTVWMTGVSLVFVVIYPFMKRFTYWPQIFLGLAFNWGALVGWTAVAGSMSPAPILLYLAGIAWTLHYDTIYAHQDKEDDILIGVKSTALRFGAATKPWISGFAMLSVALVAAACATAGLGWPANIGLVVFALHLSWQIRTLDIDDPANCLKLFKSNRDTGLLLLVGLAVAAI